MSKVFKNYDEKFVATTEIFTKSTDVYAYVDSAATVKMDNATMKNLFHKGCVIVVGGTSYVPVSYLEAAGKGTLTYVVADGTTASTAVLTLLKSKEHAAG